MLLLVSLSACSGLFQPVPTVTPAPPPPTPLSLGPASGDYDPLGKSPGAIAEYQFEVRLDMIGGAAQVVQFVDVTNPGPDAWDQIVFQIPAHMDDTVFLLSGASLFDGLETQAARYLVSDDGFITVFVPNGVPPNGGVGVSLVYGLQSVPTITQSRRPYGNVGYSREGILQFINWYPALVPYRPGLGWLVWAPTSVGDAVVTESADYELIVTAPDDETTVVSGGPVSRNGREWRFRVQGARSIAFAASSAYVSEIAQHNGVTIYSYYQGFNELGGQAMLRVARESLDLFSERFGPYPYSSLVIAESAYLHSAVGAGIILHSAEGYVDYTGQPDTLLVSLLPQSLSQMWWGGVVGSNAVLEPWINGSLALYSEYLYYERYYPALTEWFWENRVNYWDPEGPLEQTAYDFSDTSLVYRNVWRSGALFMHDLRQTMGDEAFFAFLQDLYRNGAYMLIDGDDVFEAVNRHTNRSLAALTSEYFELRAVPTIEPTERLDVTPTPPLTYTVQEGDTLLSIAFQFNVSVDDLRAVNGLEDDIVSIGQRLIIPGVRTP